MSWVNLKGFAVGWFPIRNFQREVVQMKKSHFGRHVRTVHPDWIFSDPVQNPKVQADNNLMVPGSKTFVVVGCKLWELVHKCNMSWVFELYSSGIVLCIYILNFYTTWNWKIDSMAFL